MSLTPFPQRAFVYHPPNRPWLNILHVDDDVLVLCKQSGLLSVPGKASDHRDCLESRAQTVFPTATTVHRLDNATSGVQVMARNMKAHRHLSRQFEKRQTTKVYIAKVWGHVAAPEGRVDLPLICDWPDRPRQHVDFITGKQAITNWQVLQRGANFTRLKLTPVTGRSHQLRVHMLNIGHPILGDNFYAHEDAHHAAGRLQLHAQSLGFYHPNGGRRCTFTSPCPF